MHHQDDADLEDLRCDSPPCVAALQNVLDHGVCFVFFCEVARMLRDRLFLDKSTLRCVTGPQPAAAGFSSDTTTTTTDASSPNGVHALPSQISDPSINSDLNLVASASMITSHTSIWALFFSMRSSRRIG